jgi:hypothetical protein
MEGSDLSVSKAEAVKAHLIECPECQQEYDALILSREKMKEWLEKDRGEWEETEWQQAVRKAIGEKAPALSLLAPWPFKKGWAYAMMGVLAVVFTVIFVIKPFPVGETALDSEMVERTQAQLLGSAFEESPQEIVRMIMVLPETGQKIVWFFDKNFELEDTE